MHMFSARQRAKLVLSHYIRLEDDCAKGCAKVRLPCVHRYGHIACMASFSADEKQGVWIDCTSDERELEQKFDILIRREEAWAHP